MYLWKTQNIMLVTKPQLFLLGKNYCIRYIVWYVDKKSSFCNIIFNINIILLIEVRSEVLPPLVKWPTKIIQITYNIFLVCEVKCGWDYLADIAEKSNIYIVSSKNIDTSYTWQTCFCLPLLYGACIMHIMFVNLSRSKMGWSTLTVGSELANMTMIVVPQSP